MRRAVMLSILMLTGCGQDAPPPPPLPSTGVVAPGESYSLAALVAVHAGGATVSWSVEPGGGTITSEGVYTAPTCAQMIASLPAGTDLATAGQITGTEHVTATWAGGSLPITVTVTEEVLGVSIEPATVEVEVGETVQFHARIAYTCHEQVTP